MGTDMETKSPKEYYCWVDNFLYLDKYVLSTFYLSMAHIFGLHGIYFILTGHLSLSHLLLGLSYILLAELGITLGAHRLWTHRTFKAKLPLRILLTIMQTIAVQYPIFKWCRDHRIHHKYTDTDADPHDSRKGFWFSHLGWFVNKEHPAVMEKQHQIDFSDLDNDPIIRFQTKYYLPMMITLAHVIPIYIAHLLAPETTFYQRFCLNFVWWLVATHNAALVNSGAHRWGTKPYDKAIFATENKIISFLAIGEGWHNYHHTFPYDYRAAELGFYKLNLSTNVIDFFAWIGWAYDLKTVREKIVKERVARTGDGSHSHSHSTADATETSGYEHSSEELPPWGWGDKDITQDMKEVTEVLHRRYSKSN